MHVCSVFGKRSVAHILSGVASSMRPCLVSSMRQCVVSFMRPCLLPHDESMCGV